MPIRPENKHRYPANWQEIRTAILERAGNKCEKCGVANYAVGARDPGGIWFSQEDIDRTPPEYWGPEYPYPKIIRIVLTISHLDHTPENVDFSNLRALCQLCHNRYDAKHRQENRAKTLQYRRDQATASLPLIAYVNRQAEGAR